MPKCSVSESVIQDRMCDWMSLPADDEDASVRIGLLGEPLVNGAEATEGEVNDDARLQQGEHAEEEVAVVEQLDPKQLTAPG